MIAFAAGFALAYAAVLTIMLRKKKPARETVLFSVLSLAGLVLWLSILMNRPINPNGLIGRIIDSMAR